MDKNKPNLKECKYNYDCECKVGGKCMYFNEVFSIDTQKSCSELELRLLDFDLYRKYHNEQVEQIDEIRNDFSKLLADIQKFGQNIYKYRVEEDTRIKENSETIEIVDNLFKNLNEFFKEIGKNALKDYEFLTKNIKDLKE
jgi:hypothetical protein